MKRMAGLLDGKHGAKGMISIFSPEVVQFSWSIFCLLTIHVMTVLQITLEIRQNRHHGT